MRVSFSCPECGHAFEVASRLPPRLAGKGPGPGLINAGNLSSRGPMGTATGTRTTAAKGAALKAKSQKGKKGPR